MAKMFLECVFMKALCRWYPDRESNSELSFRRALLYPFNYQGNILWVQR